MLCDEWCEMSGGTGRQSGGRRAKNNSYIVMWGTTASHTQNAQNDTCFPVDAHKSQSFRSICSQVQLTVTCLWRLTSPASFNGLVRFAGWALVPLQGAAAVCALELGGQCRCRVPLQDVWPCALWSLGAGAAGGRRKVPLQCVARKSFWLSGVYVA